MNGDNIKKGEYPKLLLFSMLTVIKGIPGLYFARCIIGLIVGCIIGFTAVVNDYFYNGAISAAQGGVQSLTMPVIWLGLFMLSDKIMESLYYTMYSVMLKFSRYKLRSRILEKAAKIPAISFEDPSFLDNVNKAEQGINPLVYITNTFTDIFTNTLPIMLITGGFLLTLHPKLLWSLLIIMMPIIAAQVYRGVNKSKLEQVSAPLRRKNDYYKKTIGDREYFKETRLLGAFDFLMRLYRDTVALLNKNIWRIERKNAAINLSLRVISLAGYGFILWQMVSLLTAGIISVGSFAAVLGAVAVAISRIEWMIEGTFGIVADTLGSVNNLMKFLKHPEREVKLKTVIHNIGKVELRNVSFRYPGRDEDALKNVSLIIEPGETIAIVGANGAGKTTLVRVLSGIYLPGEGEVLHNGVSTKDVLAKTLFSRISAVFQNYQKYKLDLRDNVELGDPDKPGDPDKLRSAFDKADLFIDGASFPKGLDTMLSAEFDGVELSGGQWQRVALTRGYYREHELIMLDEPTAAIDPIEESRIYNKFADLSRGKTSIIITHRMGLAKIADRILVLDRGEINDQGTHEELMEHGGLYAQMWQSQSMWYEQGAQS